MTNIHRTTGFLLLTIACILGLWYALSPQFSHNAPPLKAATIVKPKLPLKNFHLVDTNGLEFSDKNLRGQWTLMFFGYMTCPTICPKTLHTVQEVWQSYLPTKQPPARFVFANITPVADPSDELKLFVKNYHSQFLGVGSPRTEELASLSEQLGVFTQEIPGSKEIDHTAALMLIDPQARLRAIFTPPLAVNDIVADLDVLTRR